MRYDCGLTHPDGWAEWRFFMGWPRGTDLTELLVLIHTPGIPLQWVHAALNLSSYYRNKLKVAREGVLGSIHELGKENATTLVTGDGMRMLRALDWRKGYNGQVPLWSTLELSADPRTARQIADELGASPAQIRAWRRSQVFDPLTGARVVREVGNPRASVMHARRRS
jgi:hypothetical protein